jgi:hypothetical protein
VNKKTINRSTHEIRKRENDLRLLREVVGRLVPLAPEEEIAAMVHEIYSAGAVRAVRLRLDEANSKRRRPTNYEND